MQFSVIVAWVSLCCLACSAILFTLLGSLDSMDQIFPSKREPITERGGSSKTMTTSMRHTEAVVMGISALFREPARLTRLTEKSRLFLTHKRLFKKYMF